MNTYPRVIKLEDENLKEWVTKKGELVDEGRELTKQIGELENKRAKLGLQIEKYKDKIIPRVNELAKPYITDEFEDLETVKLEDGQVVLTIFSHLENFKSQFKEQKEKQNN